MTRQHQASGGVHRVMADIIELCELQWQLISVDGEEAKRRGVKGLVFLIGGALIALSALTTLVIAAGYLVHEQLSLSVGTSMLIAGGGSLALALLALWAGARSLRKANESLAETKREFAENVRWIKSVVLSPRTSARNPLRRESFPADRMPVYDSTFQRY